VLALGASHASVSRGRRETDPVRAHRTVGAGFLVTLLLVVGAVASVSAGLRVEV
jgi:hypothetical protein